MTGASRLQLDHEHAANAVDDLRMSIVVDGAVGGVGKISCEQVAVLGDERAQVG